MSLISELDNRFAIIGLGCRLPPSASSLPAFWRFLMKGGDGLKPLKKDRWDWRKYFDVDQNRPGKTYQPKAAYLDGDYRQFDPGVFGISPREASFLDPQQRLLLEITWEALEDAGIPLERVSNSLTGVFIGAFCLDQLLQQAQPSNRYLLSAHSTVGASMTIISNRLSHAFNLRGPSLTLDTACSSSLVALHYACQSLQVGDSDMVLAGGVNVMTRPEFPIMMSKGHFLSDHGECRAFDETAAGYARGEGAGIVVIKTLRKALADGDQIHAVIRGTGANQDGHTDGISLPNSTAQGELLENLYRKCGVAAAEVDYVEAHGTGTQAGDFAETLALHTHFSKGRAVEKKLLIGSVKSNIGHLEAAAGMAGLFKAIGILKNRQIPKNLHFKNPNPKIPFADYCLQVVGETAKLPTAAEKPKLLVGVNSFGYGGTNAHVVLESAPAPEPGVRPASAHRLRLIPFSANSEQALRELAGKVAFQLGQPQFSSLPDLAYTTAFRRSHLDYRYAALTDDVAQLRDTLIAASTGQPQPSLIEGTIDRSSAAKGLVFVYTGMGPQWWAMGHELIRAEPIVAETINEIDAHFCKIAGWSLKEAMLADEKDSRMERTEVAQTANFALQVALTRLWASYGVTPVAVVGHSVGEVASAYVSGIYSLEDAVKVSYHRSRLQQKMAGLGAMLAVGLAEKDAEKLIADLPGISVAAINSFSAVTLSGDKDQLDQVVTRLEPQGIFHRFLRVEVAYHSPQMDPLRDELAEVLAGLTPHEPHIPIYSTAYGAQVDASRWDTDYWWLNVRQAVRFADAMKAVMEDGFTSFLEVGPHPVLGSSIKECAGHLGYRVRSFTSLKRKEPELRTVLTALGELYCAGHRVDWTGLAPHHGEFLPAPPYPWQRQSHWVESERSKIERLGSTGPVYLETPLLGHNASWEVEVNKNYFPFLFDHGVQDQVVFAGMGYIEAALVLSQHIHGKTGVVLENISFEKVLIVDYARLQFLLSEFDSEAGRFTISSRVEGEENSGLRHCRGRLLPQSDPKAPRLDFAKLKAECPTEVSKEAFYERLVRRGLHYGPEFQPTTEVFVGESSFLVRIDGRKAFGEDTHPLHPTIFDAAVQPVLYCAKGDRLFVPFTFERFTYYSRPGEVCYAFGRNLSQTDTIILAEIWLLTPDGEVLAHAEGAACQLIETELKAPTDDLYYELTWKAAPMGERTLVDDSRVAIFAKSDEFSLPQLMAAMPNALVSTVEDSGRALTESSRDKLIFIAGGGHEVFTLNESAVKFLQDVIASRPGGADVTFVTEGARSVGEKEAIPNLAAFSLGALGLVAQNENENLVCRSIDSPSVEDIVAEIGAGRSGDIAYRNGERFESVLHTVPEVIESERFVARSVEEPVVLRSGGKGKIDALRYEWAERPAPQEGEIELRIQRTGVNYEDLQKIEGRLRPIVEDTFYGNEIGMECAGTVIRVGANSGFLIGDRVVALVRDGFRSHAVVSEAFAVKIPDHLGWDVAGISMAYLVAYRGLVDLAHLQEGERVLIHHATGGVGLAAVAIAKWIGAEIFATAGSVEKREYLRQLGVNHVYSSRDLDFGEQIREATQHEGIDVVIGAQSGQAVHVSLNALRGGGRYVEIGKKDIADDNSLPLRAFSRNLIFAALDIDRLMKSQPGLIQRTLQAVFAKLADGSFSLGPTRTFAAAEVGDAFREMAANRHIGKMLVDFSSGDVDVLEKVVSQPIIKADGSYIVTGGTSGFGLVTGRWLADQGAGRIVLVSRSGRKACGLEETIEYIEARGAQLEIRSVDITNAEQVEVLVAEAGGGEFALRGIFHGAMVLDDAVMTDVTPERLRRVLEPKVAGALNLAAAIRGAADLDFLVFYSSISSVIGNRGQTNYVAANALLDGLAQKLQAEGVPAMSINWGALGEVGVVARDAHIEMALSAGGITGLSNEQAFTALNRALRFHKAQMGAFLVDWAKWHEAHPHLAEDPRFRELRVRAGQGTGGGVADEIRQSLAGLSKEQRLSVLEQHLQEVLAGTLRMPKENVPLNRKINEMGVDSLMVLELSLGIKERLGVTFTAMEFLKGPTLQQLAILAETRLWGK